MPQEQVEIFRILTRVGKVALELLRDQGNGGERRAELMGRGGGEAIESGELLFAASTISVAASASDIWRASAAIRLA